MYRFMKNSVKKYLTAAKVQGCDMYITAKPYLLSLEEAASQ